MTSELGIKEVDYGTQSCDDVSDDTDGIGPSDFGDVGTTTGGMSWPSLVSSLQKACQFASNKQNYILNLS